MRPPFALPLLAAAAIASAAAHAQDAPALRDFSLPPAPAATASPRVQGPVDPDQPIPTRPRPVATATPRPTTPAAPTIQPQIVMPEPVPARAAARSTPVRSPATASPQPAMRPREDAAPPSPPAIAPAPKPSAALPAGVAASPPLPNATSPTVEVAQDRHDSLAWPIAIALTLAGLAAGILWWWRRRDPAERPRAIERPVVAANDDPPATDALKVELAAIKLTRSFMNATLAYRVTLRNRSTRALSDVGVAGELIGAHGSQPLENQIASAEAELPELHRIDRLAPGQSRTVEGTLTLPVQAITPIRQGSAALFVPLLRLVVSAPGGEPLARTFVVGQPSAAQTGRLTPFRLDEPPRSYQPIGQRALD